VNAREGVERGRGERKREGTPVTPPYKKCNNNDTIFQEDKI
jgi:hypothetical protein